MKKADIEKKLEEAEWKIRHNVGKIVDVAQRIIDYKYTPEMVVYHLNDLYIPHYENELRTAIAVRDTLREMLKTL